MMSVFSPDKPTTCTMKLTRAILQSFIGKLQCSLGRILDRLLNREVGKLSSTKPTPLGPFLFHLYVKNKFVTEEEQNFKQHKLNRVARGLLALEDWEAEGNSYPLEEAQTTEDEAPQPRRTREVGE